MRIVITSLQDENAREVGQIPNSGSRKSTLTCNSYAQPTK